MAVHPAAKPAPRRSVTSAARPAGNFAAPPKVGFVSLGCPKALVDSERILTQLRSEGYAVSPTYAGADLVIPAEGVLNEVVYANGLRRIGKATVMDCVGVVLMHAEMMVRARRVLGLEVGREWSYPKASPELVKTLRQGTGRATT